MPWPRKIATAKPHERPKPFDNWYLRQMSKSRDVNLPMATELLHAFCGNDEKKFERLNSYLEDAFNAGVKHGKSLR